MATDLVNRLCQIYEGNDVWKNISAHSFKATLSLIQSGEMSVQDVKDAYQMSANEQATFDVFIANINAGTPIPSVEKRAWRVQQIESVLIAYEESGIPTTIYANPDEVQTALLAIS